MKQALIDYLIGCGDALSQLLNKVLFNGHANESLSGRSYRENRFTEKLIDTLFYKQDHHCKTAHENDLEYARWLLKNKTIDEQNKDG